MSIVVALEDFKPIGKDKWQGWAQVGGGPVHIQSPQAQRQSTNRAGPGPMVGHEQDKGRGLKQGMTPQWGGGSVNHKLPLTICGFCELWT